MQARQIFDADRLNITLYRLTHQVIEKYQDIGSLYIIGIQPRGVLFSKRIHQLLQEISHTNIPYGELDATFFRDDFKQKNIALIPNPTIMPFDIDNKKLLIIDDVLYTGRTVRSALSAILTLGRPLNVELMVLIDRIRKREYPIEAQYVGKAVETIDHEKVFVEWQAVHGADSVRIESFIHC